MNPYRVVLALALAAPLSAGVRLPAILSDHMVLQQGVPVRIWGSDDPGRAVAVAFRDQKAAARADAHGNWVLFLKPLAPGAAAVLTVTGSSRIDIHDVLVGEVWHASGQSNMQLQVSKVQNAEAEIAAANEPEIREFRTRLIASDNEAFDVEGSWRVATPETVKDFSAAGYFFARDIHVHLRRPVGIINTSWGAKQIEPFLRRRAIEAEPSVWPALLNWYQWVARYPQEADVQVIDRENYPKAVEKARAAGKPPPPRPGTPIGAPDSPRRPSGIYNGMVAPVLPYSIRGFLWYQGESNATAEEAFLYRRLFRLMIEDWRAQCGQGELPFLFVQLASFAANGWWPLLRESQADALALRGTGMAVTIDIGDATNIHPKNKQEVGRRLALLARSIAYGEKLVASGPLYRQMSRQGPAIRLWFDSVGGGLAARGGGALTGFTIAGADGKFLPAEARLEGPAVMVSNPSITDPVAVRYGWEDDPACSLMNAEGLPASPFRTDAWPGP